jgi:hypothetical protein
MVAARALFFGAGHYVPLAGAIADLAAAHAAADGMNLETGAGTACYRVR